MSIAFLGLVLDHKSMVSPLTHISHGSQSVSLRQFGVLRGGGPLIFC